MTKWEVRGKYSIFSFKCIDGLVALLAPAQLDLAA